MEAERAHELLTAERARIERALARLSVADRREADASSEPGDAADGQLYQHEFDEGEVDELRAELAAVERAEARLAAGSYGRSVESGAVIPDERLEAYPAAERTVEEERRWGG
jgi:DnaK suppressor protein